MENESNVTDGFVQLLPFVPLHKLVIFPYMNANFELSGDESITSFEGALDEGREVFLATHQVDAVRVPDYEAFNKIGVVTRIKSILRTPDGPVRVTVEGVRRARFLSIQMVKGAPMAEIQDLPEENGAELLLSASRSVLVDFFHKYAEVSPKIPKDAADYLEKVDNCDKLCDLIAAHVLETVPEQLEVLNIVSIPARIERLCVLLAQKTEQAGLQMQLEAKVRQLMEKNQREYFLREQMKVIRKELGSADLTDVTELREQLDKINFEPAVREKIDKDLERLENMTPGSPDINVLHTYLETIADLPWGTYTQDDYSLDRARKVLARDHYGLEKVKERILEYLAVHALTRSLKGTILCLVGPPGVGKTSIARSIARALNRSFVRMSLGGVRDEAEIRGHRRTYIGAIPGRIITSVKQAGTMNPVMLLDEIDKLGRDYRGDPAAALLEVLDPEQNRTFQDHYLDLDFDLSDVMFVATSNSYDIPPALLDRMEVINLSGYTEDEKMHIAEEHLVPKQMKMNGVKPHEVTVKADAIRDIIRYYTREAGVRGLERSIGKIFRKVVHMNAEKGDKNTSEITVDAKNLSDFLGVRKYTYGVAQKEPQVGQVNGLAWTEVGGDILTVEAVVFPGKGVVQRTGSLGDVMKESVEAARSVVRARAAKLGIENSAFANTDWHIHFPEGATPKDGPSAGAAICTAIVSAMTNIPVRPDVAMTGEITLRGEILEIGGLKEKLLAALRGGIKKVLIPETNVKDLAEIPDNVKTGMEIVPVRWIDQVLEEALVRKPEPLKTDSAEKAATAAPIPAAGSNAVSGTQATAH